MNDRKSLILKNSYIVWAIKVLLSLTEVNAINVESLNDFQPEKMNDVSCHGTVTYEKIPSADEVAYPEKSIFFIESSCRGGLDSRQACAVEAAARANPGWQVNILFAGPVAEVFLEGDKLLDLKEFDNVKVRRIHVIRYVKETPLEGNLTRLYGMLRKSLYPVHHAVDILRLLTLYKFGGVYLDLDMISVKSFNRLPPNWVAREMNPHIGSAVLAASKKGIGRVFTEAALRELLETFDPRWWNYNGPGVITRVLRKLCAAKHLEAMRGETCQGFEVFLDRYFYPIDYFNWKDYFKPSEGSYEAAFTHHFWNALSHSSKVPQDSLLVQLAKNYCPTVYSNYGDEFGTMRFDPD